MFSSSLLILLVTLTAIDGSDLNCPPSNSGTSYVKLKDAVFCNYDSSVRPVANHLDVTTVFLFKIIVNYFDFDIITSTFSLDAWLSLCWIDEHLSWNPSEHDNIKNIYLNTYQIWAPDLSVYNLAFQGEDPEIITSTRCLVSYTGTVICVLPVHIDALCVPNLSKYPFDKQDCKLRLGSWMHTDEEVNVVVDKSVVKTDYLMPNGEWEILSHSTVKHKGVYACCPNNTYPSIDVNFTIRRLAGSHAATMVIPIIVCVILTLSLLTLSPVDKERLIFAYVNLITHFMQVQYVSWQLPLKGDNMPLIIIFSIDSLLLALAALVFTLIFKSIMMKKSMPPAWISSIISGVISCKPGQWWLLTDYTAKVTKLIIKEAASAKGEEDGTGIVNSNIGGANNTQDWELFGKLLDKVFFLVYILVYFIMIVSLLP